MSVELISGAHCNRLVNNATAIVKTEGAPCADISYDGNPATPETDLNLIQIGWNIGGSFLEQIRICQDRKVFNSPFTHLNLRFGAAVEHSEKRTISSQFAFQSSIARCSKWVSNVE